MFTNVAYLEFGVRDLDACRDLFVDQLRLTELGHGPGSDGGRVSIISVGPSLLELHEDPGAVTQFTADGQDKDMLDVPGSIQHISFYTQDNWRVFTELKEEFERNRNVPLGDGPSDQPLNHSYVQRSLVSFQTPDGYGIQVSECIDPREHLTKRLAYKKSVADRCEPHHFQGLDHLHIISANVEVDRMFFGGILGLEELEHRFETYPPIEGFEESTFGAGMTELEVSRSDVVRGRTLGPGSIRGLGFWTDDVDKTFRALVDRGLQVDGEPADRSPLPDVPRRGFTFRGLGGMTLEVAQRQ